VGKKGAEAGGCPVGNGETGAGEEAPDGSDEVEGVQAFINGHTGTSTGKDTVSNRANR